MRLRLRSPLVLILWAWFLQSCSNIKFLAEDEKLYTYTWFSEQGFEKIKNKPLKAYELYLVGKVKTNRPIVLLPRTSLTIYNYCKPTGKWGPRYYIHKVFAKPPVLLKEVNPEFRAKVMEQRLAEMGHFDSNVKLDLKEYGKHQKKVRAKYNIFFKPAYTYRTFEFYNQHTRADSIISASMSQTLIRPGDEYWLKILEEERSRVNKVLKNQGHYFFNSDFLLFHADTTVGKKQVDLTMVIKDKIPENAYKSYSIRNVTVRIRNDNPTKKKQIATDSIFMDPYQYLTDGQHFRPKIITRHLSVKPGKRYTYSDHENTTRYLQGMAAFRSVNVTFEVPDTTLNQLDATIDLIPLKPIQTSLEINFATKSNDFLGPSAIASVGHRNIFKGAEQLTLQVDGGFEWQKRSKTKYYELGVNSYEIGTQLKLSIPRFLIPLRLKNQSPRYVPKTYASIGFRSLKRVKYYSMNLSQLKFGYTWRNSPRMVFKVEPFSADYLRLTQTSKEFDEFLTYYPQVAKSFEEQFIIGSLLSATYTNNPKNNQFNHYYLNMTLDLAGNLLNSIYNATGLKDPGSDDPGKLFGTPYSQYTKITNDFRYYIYFNEKRQIATRLLVGVGVPYNNSEVLPYVKQYFAGGSQDIRAFYARSIGPGKYSPSDSTGSQGFLDQSGEIKLIGNIEYRFPITYKTYGAFFIDAGNVWLINDDESRPQGKFEFNRFLDDIAIGSGFGIRVDIDYFIFRLDVAVPVRKPFIDGAEKWIFNNSGFFNDYIFSLAVGYPF
ncbi:MAG: BamA/TamA family outer membrane protein [Bacteroidetes bacterium]|nr:BamA/TamA family outer membrane protein [Bacteroidota bacterium]